MIFRGWSGGFVVALMALLAGCGDPPTDAVVQQGDVRVEARLPDGSAADSISLIWDDEWWGVFPNPHTCSGLYAGIHKLEVSAAVTLDSTTTVVYSDLHDSVTVEANTMLQLACTLMVNYAPDFALYDQDSVLVTMSNHAGEVVLLYFFSST